MPRQDPESSEDAGLRQRALSRWENEGGAGGAGSGLLPAHSDADSPIPELTNAELVALRVRVIALENLMISLLATASDQQRELAREMASYISPRPGFTPHPLTISAAGHMNDLVQRSSRFNRRSALSGRT
jgi:hypothetical protein